MKKIVYYVAISLDGYIAGVNDDISMFIPDGEGVEKYLSDLQSFKTVIMGRRTYEFGYQFGLQPGQLAYPHMQHYIFSDSLHLDSTHDLLHIEKLNIGRIQEIKEHSSTDVYLCGGGEFAGWLLDHGQIDILKLKINPIILGDGISLFGNSKTNARMNLTESTLYENGLQIITYELIK
ncbi:dihydrofolate reductase [Dokdonia pacifica]|uniref:Dihydrofolate reductase n=1 Tax=Dokdonia pacifica TaxID=1627892 RepID=A0A238Z8T7_9FLAO|nr:dihydrofolate reductase family protein [Dokdonia pacifica]GGG04917.1 dihydrofolate reductase [Dokdonia pacifica]SNR79499.1 Dihydrofolate reductase [Dokdonia pacifica]